MILYIQLLMTRVRYYARSVRLSSQKQMTITSTPEAVAKQGRAMGAKAFEIGLFDPNAAQGAMFPRVWNLDTLLRSVSWLRLKNAEDRNIYIRPAGEHSLSLIDDASIQMTERLKSEGFAPAVGGLALNHVSSPDTSDDSGVQVASLLDVAGRKMAVVQRRAQKERTIEILQPCWKTASVCRRLWLLPRPSMATNLSSERRSAR